MKAVQDTLQILCPHCGQPNEIYVDYSGGQSQDYVEDCQVCCRSWEVRVILNEDEPAVTILRSDE